MPKDPVSFIYTTTTKLTLEVKRTTAAVLSCLVLSGLVWSGLVLSGLVCAGPGARIADSDDETRLPHRQKVLRSLRHPDQGTKNATF